MNTASFSHIITWQSGVVFDSLILLFIVAIIWFVIRRFASPQWGIALFLLVLLKAACPLPISVPNPIAALTPSHIVQQTLTTQEHDSTPTLETASIFEDVVSNPPIVFDAALSNHATSENRTEQHHDSYFVDEFDHDYYEKTIVVQNSDSTIAEQIKSDTIFPEPQISGDATQLESGSEFKETAISLVSHSSQWENQPPDSKQGKFSVSISTLLFGVWFAVVLILTTQIIVRQIRFHISLGKAKLIPCEELPFSFQEICRSLKMRTVPVYEYSAIGSPAVYGLFRPIILLPQGLLQKSTEAELRWILLHEIAHIRRFDCWYVLAIHVICVLFFFNPAVWVSRRMIHRLREFACDDFASYYSNVSPLQASEAFMKILRNISQKRKNDVPALAVIDSRNSTMQRMQRILDHERPLHIRFGLRSIILWFMLAALFLPRLVGSEAATLDTKNEKSTQINNETKTTIPENDTAKIYGSIFGTITDPQGKPVPRADVEIIFSIPTRPTEKTKTNEKGEYRLPLTESQLIGSSSFTTIRASAIHDGKKMIGISDPTFFTREEPLLDLLDTPIPIEVRPVNRTEIIVQNIKGEPVSGAKIEALVDFADGFQAPFAAPETDSDGRSVLEIPDNIAIRDVWVMKSGVGMDYLHNTTPPENAGLDLREERYRIAERLSKKIEFMLRGAEKYTVHVQDSEKKPVPGASIGPWILSFAGQTDCLNLSCSRICDTLTDADGNAVLDWIPVNRVEAAIEYHVNKGNFRSSQRPNLIRGVFEQTFTLNTKTWNINGTVFDENGEPLPGVLVEASWTNRTLTDENGKYQLQVENENDKNIQIRFRPPLKLAQRNLVPGNETVDITNWKTDNPESVAQTVDYSFKKGTPVHFKVVVNDGKLSYQEMLKKTKELGRSAGSGPFLFHAGGVSYFDKHGTLSMVLPAGKFKYSVQIPKTKIVDLDPNTRSHISREIEIPENPEEQEKMQQNGAFDITFRCYIVDTIDRKFQVVRVDPKTGEKTPEKNATVYFSRDFTIGLYGWKKIVTDENGVTIIRRSDPTKTKDGEKLSFLACSQDGSYSGLGIWQGENEEQLKETKIIELHPGITLKGRCTTPDGQPFTDGTLQVALQQHVAGNFAEFIHAFHISGTENCHLFSGRPDKEGHFEFKGLFPGFRYTINLQKYVMDCDEDRCQSRLVQLGRREITIKEPDTYDLGDIICVDITQEDATLQPYVDTTTKSPPVLLPIKGKVDVAALEAAYIAERSKNSYELSGTVLDSKGNPAQSATVILHEYGNNAPTDPNYISQPVKTDHEGKFRVSTKTIPDDFVNVLFVVQNSEGTEQAFVFLRDHGNRARLKSFVDKPVDIKLAPVYSTKIVVKNKDNQPLPGASVHVITKRFLGFHVGTTDESGEFLLKLPEGTVLSSVFALKSNEGVDYTVFENKDDTAPQVIPPEIELKLEGTLPRRVQVLDEQGRALVGLPLMLQSLQLPGKAEAIGLLPCVLTDEQGIATFDFLPPEVIPEHYNRGSIGVLPQSFLYPIPYQLRMPSDEENANGITQFVLSRCATINGQVLDTDGSPIPDLLVNAVPAGNFWISCYTDEQGRYSLRNIPNLFEKGAPDAYQHTARDDVNGVFAARNDNYTVIPWCGYNVKPGEEITHDLQATSGIVLRIKMIVNDGEISFEKYKEMIKEQHKGTPRVILDYQYVASPKTSPIQGAVFQPERKRLYGMSRNLNENGEYTFRVPPGAFQIRPVAPGADVETVDGQILSNINMDFDFNVEESENAGGERVIECRVRIRDQKTYTLRVVRADDPTVALSGVTIFVYPDDRDQYDQIKLKTNEKGEATISRSSRPLTYLVLDRERNLGASEDWLEIPNDKTTIDIPLYPLVKAKGQLVGANGKPLANKELTCEMHRTVPRYDATGKLTSRMMIRDEKPISAKTDEQGRFEIDGLVRKTEYHIMVFHWNEATKQNDFLLRKPFNTEEKEVVDLKMIR